jgi:hypothetical protein
MARVRKLVGALLVLLALLACANRLVASFHTVPRHEVAAVDRSMGAPETPPAPHALVAGSPVLSHTTTVQDYSTHATWPVYWSAPATVNSSEVPRTAPAPAPRRLFPLLV